MGDLINVKDLSFSAEMLNLIAEIDEFKGVWQQIGRITPDRLSALKKIATIESIGSSTRIEGAKLSDRDVEKRLTSINTQSFQNRDEQEVAGYAYVCEKIFDHYNSIQISENYIKQMHMWLLRYSDKDDGHRGNYKKVPIRIEAFVANGRIIGTIFETTSPMETPFQMHDLLKWIANEFEKKVLHPLIIISLFIVIFLAIHPFQDGNGRLARLLTTLLMLKKGYNYIPYSSLESIIEHNKESYYLALQKTQTSWQKGEANWSPWILFFLRCLRSQKIHLEKKISKERILLKELPELQKRILDLIETHGPLSIHDLVTLTKGNRNTIKRSLSVLVKSNYISMLGVGKATRYILK